VLETRDSVDGQVEPDTSAADLAHLDTGLVYPLTGPVFVKGAEPGDMLEVEFLDIVPQPTAFSVIIPGMGFLRDIMTRPFVVHWKIRDGWATSAEIPGVRIPGGSWASPAWRRRRKSSRNGPSASSAPSMPAPSWCHRGRPARVPGGRCGIEGLRTIPPRENGGNIDVKQLTEGAKLLLPVFMEGALFSTGDAHFAQGDGEVCITAVEMSATVAVRFKIHKGLAARRTFAVHAQRLLCRSQDCRAPQFSWCYGHADQ